MKTVYKIGSDVGPNLVVLSIRGAHNCIVSELLSGTYKIPLSERSLLSTFFSVGQQPNSGLRLPIFEVYIPCN